MVVDGSFLKASYKGTILTSCTHDEVVGKILPLAYAIVDSENNKSWEGFFVQIKGTFGVREGICIVSDRNESIFNATKVVYPEVPHCICMFHLWHNVKRTFKKHHKQLKDIFFALVRAYTIEKFDYHMIEMCKTDPRVQTYLFEIGYKLQSEKWNNKNRKSAMETSTKLGEKYDKLLRENLIASDQMTVGPATKQLYTVFEGVRRNIVCLEEGTCSCGKFQMDELSLNPMPDESLWVIPTEVLEDVVLPPKGRRNAGRPRKERLKPASEKESKRAFSCSVCGQGGHNRKTCRNRPK
ncbi:uncharacterized protein [Nicotiana sylvestris]|uniref:uncharacterized protein n=1 Tax=Nicotiana sylvestris TaxID=4096 RepID=UPI00388CA36B